MASVPRGARGDLPHHCKDWQGMAGETRAAGVFLASFGTLLTYRIYNALIISAYKLITSNV